MTDGVDPYDEFPYRGRSIEWSAPERLALASLLHGGPRVELGRYRLLALGCGEGANLLPLAWYRRHASFVGIDRARGRIELARQRAADLGLDNVEFIHADLAAAPDGQDGQLGEQLGERFDFILAHGLLSWVSAPVRDAVLRLCAQVLRPQGLFYFNYNTMPGWAVRGMVRDFLLAQTAEIRGLGARAEAAQAVCGRLSAAMDDDDPSPYRRLIAGELRFVCEGHRTWVAHEFLAPDNHAYWRSELLAMLEAHGLTHVADADFDQPWARDDGQLEPWLRGEGIEGRAVSDTADLLRYRQLHSPIVTTRPWSSRPPQTHELGALRIASCLNLRAASGEGGPWVFEHPSGYEVEVRDEAVREALRRLQPRWPAGLRVDEVFADVEEVAEDLLLLHRNDLVRLRLVEPEPDDAYGDGLARHEAAWGGYRTTARHTRVAVATSDPPDG
ncbi:MAG: class I SAM-dependent methyltransferase [Myxococcota bacterium]